MDKDGEPSDQPVADANRRMLAVDRCEEEYEKPEDQNVQKGVLHERRLSYSGGRRTWGRALLVMVCLRVTRTRVFFKKL
jgi:hypothetical protein